MKIIFSTRIYVLVLFAALNFSGCNEEYKSSTKINSDGSCERIIIVKADSAFIQNGYFPVPTDKSWNPEFRLMEKDTQKVYIVKKSFNNVNDMNDEYKKKNKAAVEIVFEKKFRWFYTYYSFRETYKAFNPFNRISLESFLAKEELAAFENGDTTAALKKRIDDYFMEDVFEYFYERLLEEVRGLGDESLASALLKSKKEIREKVISDKVDEKEISAYIKKIVKIKSETQIDPLVEKIMSGINEKMSSTDIRYQFTNEIIMPGILLSSNAGSLEGSKASWKFSSDRFRYLNYIMEAESRLSNQWAVYVTGGVVLIIIGLLLLPKLKRR